MHLRKSLTYNPNSVISHMFLAETLADMGRKDEARKECQAAIDAPLDPELDAGGSALQGNREARCLRDLTLTSAERETFPCSP